MFNNTRNTLHAQAPQVDEPVRYDEERYIDPIPDHFRCPICYDVVEDPQECIHCDRLHCKSCLNVHSRNSTRCPHCQRPTSLKQMNRTLKESYLSLKLRCCNAPTCPKIETRADIAAHERLCSFGEVSCDQCKTDKILRKDLEHHKLSQCQMRIVDCQYCGVKFTFRDLQSHLRTCDCVPIDCAYCKSRITKRIKAKHDAACPEQEIYCTSTNTTSNCVLNDETNCPLGTICGHRILRKNMPGHLASRCRFRTVVCGHCKLNVQSFWNTYHEKNDCLKFVHTCEKCNEKYTRADKHSESCTMELVECQWADCTQQPLRKDAQSHQEQCKHRLIDCKHCKQQFKHCNLSNHVKKCPNAPLECSYCHKTGIQRKDIKSHNGVCTMYEVLCPVGNCSHKCPRMKLKLHYADPTYCVSHIEELLELYDKVQEENVELRSAVKQTKRSLHNKEAYINKQKEYLENKEDYIGKLKDRIATDRRYY